MPHQLNIYVPHEKKATIARARHLAELQGKPPYHLVLEALEEYLEQDQLAAIVLPSTFRQRWLPLI